MKFKLLPGYPTYELKLTKRDIALAFSFIICCAFIAWMTGELIEHSGTYVDPDYRGAIVSSTGEIVWCTNKYKQWKPRSDGTCYSADAK